MWFFFFPFSSSLLLCLLHVRNRIEAHHVSPSSWTFLRTKAHAGFFTSTSHTLHVTGDVKRPAEDCRLSSGRQSWCTKFSRLGRTAEKKRKLQTDFGIKLFLLCLLSIEPKRVFDLTWKMLAFEMCLSKSDFEMFHFQVFDFQRVVDFEKHALITSSCPSNFDFENSNLKTWLKIGFGKFRFENLTLETRLEIGRLKFVFRNWTLLISLLTFDVGPLNWTFDKGRLLKIDCCWNVTLKSWLLLGFAWVFGPLAEDGESSC